MLPGYMGESAFGALQTSVFKKFGDANLTSVDPDDISGVVTADPNAGTTGGSSVYGQVTAAQESSGPATSGVYTGSNYGTTGAQNTIYQDAATLNPQDYNQTNSGNNATSASSGGSAAPAASSSWLSQLAGALGTGVGGLLGTNKPATAGAKAPAAAGTTFGIPTSLLVVGAIGIAAFFLFKEEKSLKAEKAAGQ